MRTIEQNLFEKNNKVYALVFSGENILVTNKKGKFSPRIFNAKGYELFVIRNGYYIIKSSKAEDGTPKLVVAKVVGFAEEDKDNQKAIFANCEVVQEKIGEKWTAIPPKALARAINKIELKA